MPRKYSDEFKAKAVRLAEDLVELEGCSKWGAAVEIESVRLFVCGGLGLQVVRESVGVRHS